jgi:hypothetical protein
MRTENATTKGESFTTLELGTGMTYEGCDAGPGPALSIQVPLDPKVEYLQELAYLKISWNRAAWQWNEKETINDH